jgi:dipeptidyl aminopeptidase/acylaminoacyl peptidase
LTRRRLVTLGVAVVALGVSAGAIFLVMNYLADPPSASCAAPAATFGPTNDLFNHEEVAVRYTCEGAVQAGTLYLPTGAGPHPAAIWIHGAGPATRLGFGGVVALLVNAGVAVFSYDKRGVGESQGSCCPGDNGQYNLLSADAAGAVTALASRSDLRKDEIGFIGASQAGWIAAKAATMTKVAFIALASATPMTERQANLYERLARGDEGKLSSEEISRRIASAGRSGFDPLPFLRQITAPSLWMIGTADDRIPVPESIALLNQLKNEGREIEIVTFTNAGHGLLDTPPTDPNAPPALVNWVLKRVHI